MGPNWKGPLEGAILAALPDAVLVVDDTGVVVSVNAAGERLFGYERRELVGSPVEVLVPERFRRRRLRKRVKVARWSRAEKSTRSS
jgi:PAS domain S-box-containing protein